MEEVIKILESHPLFNAVSATALVQLTSDSSIHHYKENDVIYKSGSRSEFVYLILKGSCQSIPIDNSQNVKTHGVGSLVGESGILSNRPRNNKVTATDNSTLLKINGSLFRKLIMRNDRLSSTIQVDQKHKSLYFDSNTKTFQPCKQNLTVFVNYTDMKLETEMLPEMCQTLFNETAKSVLFINFRSDKQGLNLKDLEQRTRGVSLQSIFDKNDASLPYLKTDVNLADDESSINALAPFLDLCSQHFPFIITHCEGDYTSPMLQECLKYADNVYLSILQESDDISTVKKLLSSAKGHNKYKYKPVLFLRKNEGLMLTRKIEDRLGLHIHSIIRTHPDDMGIPPGDNFAFDSNRRFKAQFGRLAREIGQCRRGLVLSSGAAKGLAHIGVIQMLEEYGIDIDAVSGASIGSYVAACWARGYNGKALEELALEYKKPFGLWELIDPAFPPRKGAIYGNKIERRLRQILQDVHFDQLSIPLHVVATNLNTLGHVFFSKGDVASAVCASCSIPGIAEPRDRYGQTYIDGGIANPLPIDALLSQGIEKIIAVSTVLTPEHARRASIKKKTLGKLSVSKRFLNYINRKVNYFASGNVFDILMRSMEAAQIRMLERDVLHAQVLIQPIAHGARGAIWHNFTAPEQYIELGRKAAIDHQAQIRELISA